MSYPYSPENWAFVLAHSDEIYAKARQMWRDGRLELEEFHSRLIEYIAKHAHKFDPERGSAVTWIYWRTRARRDKELRRLNVRQDLATSTQPVCTMGVVVESGADSAFTPANGDGMWEAHNGWGTEEAMVVEVNIETMLPAMLSTGTPKQVKAALSVVEGWDSREVRRQIRCTLKERDLLLRELGSAYLGSAA